MNFTSSRRLVVVGMAMVCCGNTIVDGADLRGFGEVTASSSQSAAGLTTHRFVCESRELALVLTHKLGRDLSQSATVPATWQQVTVRGRAVPVLLRPELASFLFCVRGTVVTVYTAAAPQAPGAAFAGIADAVAGAEFFDLAFRYPRYLDKFSHYGIGSWYPSNWGDKNTAGGKPNDVDDHFAFARQLDLVLQPNAGGYLLRNLLPKLREYDCP